MADMLLVVILGVAVVLAFLVARRRARQGSECCGTREEAPVRLRVQDRDKTHYPYATELAIGGMTCENCAIKVENALNGLPGVWATASIGTHAALVRTKEEPDEASMRAVVRKAGYVVTSVERCA